MQLTGKVAGVACVQEELLLLLTCLAGKSVRIVAHLRAAFVWTGEALVLMRRDRSGWKERICLFKVHTMGEQFSYSLSLFIGNRKGSRWRLNYLPEPNVHHLGIAWGALGNLDAHIEKMLGPRLDQLYLVSSDVLVND